MSGQENTQEVNTNQANIKSLRMGFLINAMLVTLVLVAPIPFFTRIVKDIPLVSLLLAELSLVFLVALASFPKAGIKEISRLGAQYLVFVLACVAILSVMPIDSQYMLFSFDGFKDVSSGIPNLVTVNIVGIIILNTIAFLFFGMELNRKEASRRFRNKEEREETMLLELKEEQEKSEFSQGLKKDVNSLFDMYLNDYKSGQGAQNDRLENIENILLDNIDVDITGAMCVDNNGNALHDSIFHWSGYDKESLIEVFKKNTEVSKDLGTGSLCQMMFKDAIHWYIVAKYRGNYLILQTEDSSPSPLMHTSFRVFKALRS